MKILQCSGTPLAGVAELMARTINELASSDHESRVLSAGPGKHAWYVRPGVKLIRHNIRDKDDVSAALEWADVVHFHANVSYRSLGHTDLIGKKPCVFGWHGAQIWPFERVWLPGDYDSVRWIHIGQGWIERQEEFFSEFRRRGMRVMPNLVTMHDDIHKPLPWPSRTRGLVAFAPSNIKPGAVNNKGLPVTKRALAGKCSLDVIMSAPFDECMVRKRKAVLGIDEVVTPLYHRSGLEFLSQGTPCICSCDQHTIDAMRSTIGCDEIPFINADPTTLGDTVSRLLARPSDVQEHDGLLTRAWMTKYYSSRRILDMYLDLYRGA